MRPTFPPPCSIADWIKEIREAAGLDQAAFGKKFGVSQSSVARWETGEAVPEYRLLLALQTVSDTHDLAKPGLVQPLEQALPEQETREGEVRTAVDPSRISELRDEIETAYDLMTILDKAGDGIGGDVGYGASALALAARSALDNARSMLTGVDASRASRATGALGATRACACEEA